MLPRLLPSLEIAIRGAAGVICVQWRQAIITGRVKRWSGRSRRAEARAGAERPASQEGGTVERHPARPGPKTFQKFCSLTSRYAAASVGGSGGPVLGALVAPVALIGQSGARGLT